MKRLRALDIGEERELAGRVAGLLYLTAAVTVCALLLVPGIPNRHWQWVLALGALSVIWGMAALFVIQWQRAHPLVSHFSSFAGFPMVAAAMAATGGAQSPARFYLLFTVVYCAYFYRPQEATPYVAGCIATLFVPLFYDNDAVDAGYIGELIVVCPTYAALGAIVMSGRRVLVDLSRHDPLTGVANRRALHELLDRHVGGTRPTDHLGLLVIDLDEFKDVNTLHGHPGGDRVLCCTAEALTSTVRHGDLVARLGGDEFAVVALQADELGMNALAARVNAALREAGERLALEGIRLTASSGWALYPAHARTVDDLIAAADLGLRVAKTSGKDQVHPAPERVSSP